MLSLTLGFVGEHEKHGISLKGVKYILGEVHPVATAGFINIVFYLV